LLALGAAGLVAVLWKRTRQAVWPLFLLALVPFFYLWSMHSSGTPIFVPQLWPFGWYNTRYALWGLPLAAFAVGALLTLFPVHLRLPAALALAAIGVSWVRADPSPSICWKESEVNSVARREWTHAAAEFLAEHYEPGSGIVYSFGEDLAGVLREAGIPLREGLHEGNHPAWDGTVTRPELFLREEWALAFSGDTVATAVLRAQKSGMTYALKKQIIVKGAPVVEIYQRQLPPTQ
jgi:hypothetical protein